MPAIAMKSDPLSIYADGVVAKAGGKSWPLPLKATSIAVDVRGGIAFVRATRSFSNAEDRLIEATLTFPIPGDAVLTGLKASIDGREIVGVAKSRKEARTTYEQAIDDGKASVLHEELLRGIHMLSVGNLAPGKEADVVVTYAVPLNFAGPYPTLRIPTTIGEVYGRSPLPASDDIETSDVVLEADVSVSSDSGSATVDGLAGANGRVRLDGAIVISLPGWRPVPLKGTAANGASVTIRTAPIGGGEKELDVTLLTDISGSTGELLPNSDSPTTKWTAMRDGFRRAASGLRSGDRLRLYEFDSNVTPLGEASGPSASDLADRITAHRGGTRIGLAIEAVARAHPGKDIVLVTDGRSHDIDVQALARKESRIHVVLVGPDALDAHVGRLAALTGGHCLVAEGLNVADAITSAFAACRVPVSHARFSGTASNPASLAIGRSGADISISWGKPSKRGADDVGRFAAGLAVAGMTEDDATGMAISHGLCTHLTSLVLVDEAGERQSGIPATRKVPLMRSAFRSIAPQSLSLVASGAPMAMLSATPTFDGAWMDPTPKIPGVRRYPAPKGGSAPDLPKLPKWPDVGMFPDETIPTSFPMPTGRTTFRQDMGLLASDVDWDDIAGRDLPREMSLLPRHVQLWVMKAAAEASVETLAKALGKPSILVAIALLAAAAKGYRSATRLSRSVLGGASEVDVAAATRSLAA